MGIRGLVPLITQKIFPLVALGQDDKELVTLFFISTAGRDLQSMENASLTFTVNLYIIHSLEI